MSAEVEWRLLNKQTNEMGNPTSAFILGCWENISWARPVWNGTEITWAAFHVKAKEEFDGAAAGVAAAVEAFRRFGWHHTSCASELDTGECDCGFLAAWDNVILAPFQTPDVVAPGSPPKGDTP